MKTLTVALNAELALTVTRPAYLIEILWPATGSALAITQRLSTLGDIAWDGRTWLGADAVVSGVSQDGLGSNTASLALGNTDMGASTNVLTYGAADIPVKVWAVYAGATALADAVLVFSGVFDGCDISASKVTFKLAAQRSNTFNSPRVFINQVNGFKYVLAAGSLIETGTGRYRLEGEP